MPGSISIVIDEVYRIYPKPRWKELGFRDPVEVTMDMLYRTVVRGANCYLAIYHNQNDRVEVFKAKNDANAISHFTKVAMKEDEKKVIPIPSLEVWYKFFSKPL